MNVEAAKNFITNNARPLELSLYGFFYENTNKETVIAELARYRNKAV